MRSARASAQAASSNECSFHQGLSGCSERSSVAASCCSERSPVAASCCSERSSVAASCCSERSPVEAASNFGRFVLLGGSTTCGRLSTRIEAGFGGNTTRAEALEALEADSCAAESLEALEADSCAASKLEGGGVAGGVGRRRGGGASEGAPEGSAMVQKTATESCSKRLTQLQGA